VIFAAGLRRNTSWGLLGCVLLAACDGSGGPDAGSSVDPIPTDATLIPTAARPIGTIRCRAMSWASAGLALPEKSAIDWPSTGANLLNSLGNSRLYNEKGRVSPPAPSDIGQAAPIGAATFQARAQLSFT
jgi:hypothetical protein